jgi:hypothetical protein
MKWSDIAGKVAQIAPLAGTLLGGPAGAAVGSLIGKALGVDPTPDAISQVIMNPDSVLKLKELESSERQHLLSMQLQTLQAELGDVQNARQNNKESVMPSIICMSLTAMVAAGAWMLFNHAIPEDNREFAYILYGALVAKWGDSIAYFVGTTRSSAEKTKLLGK